MATKQEQILEAIKTVLAGTTGVAKRIYRSKSSAVDKDHSPSIIIRPGTNPASPPSEGNVGQLDWYLVVNVFVISRGEVPDKAADPTVESLYSKIMADVTLGGLALDIQPLGIDTQFSDTDENAAVINCSFRVQHRTAFETIT